MERHDPATSSLHLDRLAVNGDRQGTQMGIDSSDAYVRKVGARGGDVNLWSPEEDENKRAQTGEHH